MKRIVISIFFAALMSACAGTPFDWNAARQIKPGMTESEVTHLMGSPYLVKAQGDRITWVWSYADAFSGSKAVSVVFSDGKVIAPPPIPDAFR